jgi:flagellar hook-associated protein 1 FlgK
MSISVGLDIAVRALLAQQMGVDTVSHNIANVNTDGFSRQRLTLEAVPGQLLNGSNGPGHGVTPVGVDRVRDLFVDQQLRNGSQTSGRLGARSALLRRAEQTLQEPSDFGLRSALSRYWNAWRDVASQPESSAARSVLVQGRETMAVTARRIHDSLVALRTDANTQILSDIDSINTLSQQILGLNKQIATVSLGGGSAADLRDQRDLALDELSTYLDISYLEQSDGRVDVFIGGHSLVSASQAHLMYGDTNVANSNYVDVRFVADNQLVNIGNGELRGLLDGRDTDLTARIADLNTLVAQVITDVNTAHAAGYGLDSVTGRDFFTGTDASDIAVNPVLLADPNAVAASTALAGVPGDGSNAQAIADLQYAKPLGGATTSYDQFYANFVSTLGATARETEALLESQALVNSHVEQVRQGASGVNLDEEMVQLMRYQRAYEGATRLISVIDEMLDRLINGM